MFIDNDFPKILGAELYRPHPAYIVEMAAEPVDKPAASLSNRRVNTR